MTAIIVGLGAVVFLVVAVVVMGIRSGKRRESNLPPERIKAMAEGKTKRVSTRPAEDTFFESFPEGFDSLDDEKPERPRIPRPSLGGRSGQRAAGRKNRGGNEWGDSDDYDDDYWTRMRADDDGFGGATDAGPDSARPAGEPAAPERKPAERVDPAAATVQAPLPTRPGKNLADLVETARATPSSAAAEEKTVRFSSPSGATPTPAGAPPGMTPAAAAGAAHRPGTGPGARPGSPARPAAATGPASRPAAPTGPGGHPSPAVRQPMGGPGAGPMSPGGIGPGSAVPPSRGRDGRSSRAGARPAAAAGADPLATGPRRAADPPATGPRPAAAARPDPLTDPLGTTGPRRAAGSRRAPAGPFQEGRGGATAAPLDTGRGGSPAGSPSGPRGTEPTTTGGPFPGTRLPGAAPDPRAVPGTPEVGMPEPRHSPSEPFPAMPPASATPAGLMADPPSRPTRRTPTPTGPAPSGTALPETGVFSMPPITPAATPGAAPVAPIPAAPTPAASAAPAATPTPQAGWPAVRDVLDDDPPPSSSSRETWSTAGYQTSFSDGYGSSRPTTPTPAGPVGSAGSSYEVSPGWATIDDSDTVTGPSPAATTPTGPSRAVTGPDTGGDDILSGDYYGADRGGGTGEPVAWPERDGRGSWPSYQEMYGDAESAGPEKTGKTPRGRRGSHRGPDPEFPDYYR